MTNKFQNKYRIQSARLQNWDYRRNAAYFVTICTQEREYYFGDVVDGEMQLTHTGILADVFWNEITKHANHVELGVYVVMPNHIHGIVIINNPDIRNDDEPNDRGRNDDGRNVETLHATSLQPPQSPPPQKYNKSMADISPKSGSLSTIIRSYKSAVTKHANRLGLKNGWQPRFHDHIIRDADEFKRIEDYIVNNPKKWNDDKFTT